MSKSEAETNLDIKFLAISERALRLANEALDFTANDKTDMEGRLRPRCLIWVLPLLAHLTSTARSMTLLVAKGELYSAEMLRRPFHEALANLCFILDGTNKRTEELLDLFVLDYKHDRYEQLKMLALVKKTSIEQLTNDRSIYKKCRDDYLAAQEHPVYRAKRELDRLRSQLGGERDRIQELSEIGAENLDDYRDLIQRLARNYLEQADHKKKAKALRSWKDIPMDEKEMSISEDKRTYPYLAHMRRQGNWSLHTAGPGLSGLFSQVSTGKPDFRVCPSLDPAAAFALWRPTLLAVVGAAALVLKSFYVAYELRCKIERLAKQIANLKCP